ncbi:hypothetical protein NDU88_002173 [Pleurodeles waltl]|uniref:Uncharacterized protein n=1 Tax=Pleurodeles waltl TaxID=8319 RepID=A0AAV7S9N5_PLEWA|nr:hypothetical protein NDU88_002173 [Pleurodeles waltl]
MSSRTQGQYGIQFPRGGLCESLFQAGQGVARGALVVLRGLPEFHFRARMTGAPQAPSRGGMSGEAPGCPPPPVSVKRQGTPSVSWGGSHRNLSDRLAEDEKEFTTLLTLMIKAQRLLSDLQALVKTLKERAEDADESS